MTTPSSPDLSLFDVQVLFDLSPTTPVVTFTNISTGAHLANVSYVFEVYSPNNIPIYKGNFSTPDKSGLWTTFILPAVLITFHKSVEWSGSPYRVRVFAKDSLGLIFTLPEKAVRISQPLGNKRVGNNFGEGQIDVVVQCDSKEALVRDRTPYTYQGAKGLISPQSTITIIPPVDGSGVPGTVEVFTGYSQLSYPLTVTGTGFRVVLQSLVDYALDNGVTVRIKYIKTESFSVNCNYDLCPLLYEYSKLLDLAHISCDDKLDRKIARINAMLTEAVMVKMQPMCGADLGKIIEEIKDFADWHNCDCTGGPIGLNGNSLGGPGALNIQFNTGGDIQAATGAVNGNNILLNLKDLTYIIQVRSVTSARSFTIKPNVSGNTKTYELDVNLDFLAADLLSSIGGVPALLDQFNSLVKGSFNFTVDGKCIIASNPACDYTLSIGNVPAAPLSAIFKSITIGDVLYPIGLSFNQSEGASGIAAKITTLGRGAWTAAIVAGSLMLYSTANTSTITQAVIYGAGSAEDKLAALKKENCTGTSSFTPSQIVQAMIDYLCKINVKQVLLGSDFVFASMNVDGTLKSVSFKSTDSLAQLIEVLNNNAAIAIAIGQNSSVSCDSLKAILANKTNLIKPTDNVFALRDGACGQWTQQDLLSSIIKTISTSNDQGLKAEWCKAVNICSNLNACNPVTQILAVYAPVTKDLFAVSNGNLVYAGFYSNLRLQAATTVNLTQVDFNGNTGLTGFVTMTAQTFVYNNVLDALPPLAIGFNWQVTSISGQGSNNYLQISILNNGAPSYRVAYHVPSPTAANIYATYPAQTGQYTRLVFVAANSSFDISVKALCGVNSESEAFSTTIIGACRAMFSFGVVRSGNKFLVSYSMKLPADTFNLVITYPNGGTYDQNQTGLSAGTVEIPIPEGQFGVYTFKARQVCDVASGLFGGFTDLVTVTVAQLNTVSPASLQASAVTATTALVTATAPTPAPTAESISLVYTPLAGGPSVVLTQGPNVLTWNLSNLIPGTAYNIKASYTYQGGLQGSQFDGGTFVTQALSQAVILSGWSSSAVTAANVDTFVLQQSQQISSVNVSSYLVDFSTAPTFQWFIVREPVSAPIKTGYLNALNNEAIPDYTFASPVVIGSYRYYFTNRPSSFDPTAPVQMIHV